MTASSLPSDRSNRRQFLGTACGSALTLTSAACWRCLEGQAEAAASSSSLPGHPARWYKKLPLQRVQCQLCPKQCRVDHTERGFCGVRENHHGQYRSLVYGKPCTINIDPIEKKPLFHLLPGAQTFSLATAGCNMDCRACQNWQISQARPEQIRSYDLPPEKVVKAALSYGSKLISYTYTEPVVFLEYVIDIAKLARQKGICNCMITGGNIEVAPLKEACHVLDAIKVDLKAFNEQTYITNNRGELKHILRTIETVKKSGRWLELVYLVIPTQNDSEKEIQKMCRWVKTTLGKDVPLHFTRFHPEYRLKHLPPTPYSTLKRCFQLARAEGLHFPYVGNIAGQEGEDTHCPRCQKALIKRRGFTVLQNVLQKGTCPACHTPIPGIWSRNR
jgi:pyruvate formate lyase activating enzyme